MNAKTYDLAFAEEPDGTAMLHLADCPHARLRAEQGYFVATMLECQGLPSPEFQRHSCIAGLKEG